MALRAEKQSQLTVHDARERQGPSTYYLLLDERATSDHGVAGAIVVHRAVAVRRARLAKSKRPERPDVLNGIERDGRKHRWWANGEEEAVDVAESQRAAQRGRLGQSSPVEQAAVKLVQLEVVSSVVDIDCDSPAVEEGELVVVGEDLGRRGARVLDLNATVGGERSRVEGEGSVAVEVVLSVLKHDYSGGAAGIRSVGC